MKNSICFEVSMNYRKSLRIVLVIVLFTILSTYFTAKAEETYFERGKGLAKQGQYDQAITMFDHWIISNPTDASGYYQRSRAYLELGKYQNVVDDCTKAISLSPSNPISVYADRGFALLKLGLSQRAIEDFSECIKRDPVMVLAYNNRACCLHTIGKHNEALDDLNRAISLQPDYISLYLQRAHLYLDHFGKRQEAINDYQRVLTLKPDEKRAVDGLAQATSAAPVWTAHQVESATDYLIVYVFADWCGPCKRMRPVFNEVVNEIPSQKFVLMNLDDKNNEAFLHKHNVGAVPTFLLISNRQILRSCVGAVPKATLLDFVYGRNDYDPFRTTNKPTGDSQFDKHPKAKHRTGNSKLKMQLHSTMQKQASKECTSRKRAPVRVQPPRPIRLQGNDAREAAP